MRDDESWRDYRTLFLHAREADNETFVKRFFLSPYTINVRDNEIAAFAVNSNREWRINGYKIARNLSILQFVIDNLGINSFWKGDWLKISALFEIIPFFE